MQEEEGTPNLKYYRLGGLQQEQIDTSSIKKELPDIEFIYCLEINGVPDRENRHSIQNILFDSYDDDDRDVRTVDVLQHNILDGLNRCGIIEIQSLKYFEASQRIWHQFPPENSISFKSTLSYEYKHIDDQNQGRDKQRWIVDLLVKEKLSAPNKSEPCCKDASQKLNRLETLMKGIGQSIVDHFQNDDIVPADPSSGGSSQPEEDKGEVVYGEVIEALKTLIHTDNPRDTPTGDDNIQITQGTSTPKPKNLTKQMSDDVQNHIPKLDFIQPELIHSQSMIEQHSRSQSLSTVDLAFLFSEPLLQHHKNTIIPFLGQPLDMKAEFTNIFDAIKNNTIDKKFVMKKVVATYQNLQVVMTNFPKIIHISCHGACDENNQNTYNLKFEDPDKICLSDDLTEERLRDLMGPQLFHKVQIVFISACHSETLGQLFKRMGVPIVIAVNKLTPVLDTVSQLFSKHFYTELVAGNSPKIAFENSKRLIKAGKIDAFACCCNHQHKRWCKWKIFYNKKENNKTGQESHNAHSPSNQDCKCNLKLNQHKTTCEFAKKFKTVFNLTFEEQQEYNSFFLPSFDKTESVCCCSPELTHDENNKFIIIKRYPSVQKELKEEQKQDEKKKDYINPSCLTIQQAEYLNEQDEKILIQPLFNLIEKGTCELLNDKALINQLKRTIDSNMLVGRNVIISEIVEFIKTNEYRLLHLHGPQGYGKSDIANFAGNHAMERVQLDGAMYIDSQRNKVTSVQGLIQQICGRFNEKSKQNKSNTKEHIIKTIGEKKYLFIIKRYEDIKEEQNNEQNKFIEELISIITNTQFIIITLSNNSIKKWKNLPMITKEILPLTKENAALLMIKNSNGKINFNEFKNNEFLLAKHEIFKQIPMFSPSVIVEMCDRMIDFKLSLNDLLKQENEKQQKQMNQQENLILIEARNAQWNELIKRLPVKKFLDEYNLLYIVCQMPDGLFESDIDQIWSKISTSNTNTWKIFFKKISKSNNSVEMIQNEDEFEEQKGDSQIILHLFEYYHDLEIKQFILKPLFCTLEIIKIKVKQDQYQIEFELFLNYMSNLSTHIVQNLTLDNQNDIDISNVSTIKINIKAFWYIDYCEEITLQQHPDPNNQQFQYSFLYYLPNLLKSINESSSANIENTDSIQQICINSISILLHLHQIDNARKTIIQCEQIAKKYNISSLIAKLGVLLGSVTIKANQKYESTDIFNRLQLSISFFKKQNLFCEGMAEALYLQAVIQIENFKLSLDNKSHKYNVTDGLKFKEYLLNNINQPQQQILDQLISEISQIFNESRKIFLKSSKYEFGNAKTLLIEAEILIQFKFNNQTEIIPQNITALLEDIIKISNQLLQSFKIFQSLQLINLSARSYKSIGLLLYKLLQNKAIMKIIETDESKIKLCEIEFIDNIHSYRDIAIYIFGSALEIYEKTDNQVEIEEISCIIKTFEIDYKQLFYFGSAYPLVEEIDGIEYAIPVGAVTRVHSNFKEVLIHNIKQSDTVLNVKFNQLNKQFLENIKNNGYKILHLNSSVFDQNCLCIEGEHGKLEKISVADLKKLLEPENGNPLDIELVVLAMPESHQIAKVFYDLGVKHVVSFSFKYFEQHSRFIVRAYEYIEDFCKNLYKLLLCNKVNLLQAFDTAMTESFQNTLLQSLEEFTSHEFLQHRDFQQEELKDNQGPIIQSNQQAQYQFFEEKYHNFKSKNFLIDYTNFDFSSSKSKNPITGRQCFIYELIQLIVNGQNKILNIYGNEGIGKTRIAIEFYEFLKQRNYNESKICYVDFDGVNNLAKFKEKTTKELLQYEETLKIIGENGILLIIDHVDVSIEIDALKYIINLSKNVRIIILTRTCLKQLDLSNEEIVIMEVPKLDIDQSIDLIQSICEKNIYDEIDQVNNLLNIQYKSVFEYLNKSNHVHICNGVPKYLLKLSNLMQSSILDQINIMNVLTSSVLPMNEKSYEIFEKQEIMDYDQDYFEQLQENQFKENIERIKSINDEEMKDEQNDEWEQPQAGHSFWNIVDMSPSKIKHRPNEISSQLSQSSFSIDSDVEDNNKIEKKIMRKSPNPISEIKKEKSKLNEENAKD